MHWRGSFENATTPAPLIKKWMFGEWVQAVGAKASGAIFVAGIQHINLTCPTQKKSLGQKLVDYPPSHIFTGRIDSLYNFRSPDNLHKI